MQALNIEEFDQLVKNGATIIDTRNIDALKNGFIKGSIAIPSGNRFVELLGLLSLYDVKSGFQSILLVCDDCENNPTLKQLAGREIKGYLKDGFEGWLAAGGEVDMIIDIEPDELMMDIPFDEHLVVVDLRSVIAFGSGHLKNAINLPLKEIGDPLRISAIEDKDNLYLVGNDDDEAFFAATVLKKQDIHNLRVVNGGWEAVMAEGKAEVVKEPGLLN